MVNTVANTDLQYSADPHVLYSNTAMQQTPMKVTAWPGTLHPNTYPSTEQATAHEDTQHSKV